MTRGVLACGVIALCSCRNSVEAFGRVTPTAISPPWLHGRGGDNRSTVRPITTSLDFGAIGAIGAIDNFYVTMPLASAFLTCGVKASLADAVAQKRASAEDDIEKRRNLAFLLYGGLYQGMAQEIIFNDVFPILFGQGTDLPTVISKVLFDSLCITPFVCLPVAYVVKSVIFKYSFKEAMSRYWDDVSNNGLLVKYWSLWSPVQCLTFSVVPEHLRIVWIAFISFFWLIIFSSITAKGQKERDLLDDSCSLEDGVSCRIDG